MAPQEVLQVVIDLLGPLVDLLLLLDCNPSASYHNTSSSDREPRLGAHTETKKGHWLLLKVTEFSDLYMARGIQVPVCPDRLQAVPSVPRLSWRAPVCPCFPPNFLLRGLPC